MIRQTVEVYSDNITLIQKGRVNTVVFKDDDYVCVTSMTKYNGDKPFVALVQQIHDEKELTEKYRHVVAKMIAKEPDSKYFNNPKFEQHFKNGKPGSLNENVVLQKCEEVFDQIRMESEFTAGVNNISTAGHDMDR